MKPRRDEIRRHALRFLRGVAVACSLVACSGSAGAVDDSVTPPRLAFSALPESNVRITGRATLGAWECATNDIIAVIEPGPALEALAVKVTRRDAAPPDCRTDAVAARPPKGTPAPHANITIPVASLRANKPGMRADVLRALKHEEAPLIVFTLVDVLHVDLRGRGPTDFGRYRVTARGDLVLAGALRSIEMTAQVVQETPRRFRIEARKVLSMSEFGITPPTALFGAIRADDTVAVTFDLVFEAVGR